MYHQKLYKYCSKYILNGGAICNNFERNDNISVITNALIQLNTIQLTINNTSVIYTETKLIASSKYGSVFLYESLNNPLYIPIAVKKGKKQGSLDADFIALYYLQNVNTNDRTFNECFKPESKHVTTTCNNIAHNRCRQYVVDSYMMVHNNMQYIIMPEMNMTLTDYIKKNKSMSFDDRLNIAYLIALSLQCLIDNRLLYMDLKRDNILCNVDINTNCVDIILGDIGSAVLIDSRGKSTFPPPDQYTGIIENSKEEHVCWSFGVLLIYMFFSNNAYVKQNIIKNQLFLNNNKLLKDIKPDMLTNIYNELNNTLYNNLETKFIVNLITELLTNKQKIFEIIKSIKEYDITNNKLIIPSLVFIVD